MMNKGDENPYSSPIETASGKHNWQDDAPVDAPDLRSLNLLLILFLAVITLGLYINYWVHRNANAINNALGHEKISMFSLVLFWTISIGSIGMIVPYEFVEEGSAIESISNSLELADIVFTLFMAFAVRSGLDDLLLQHDAYDNRSRYRGIWTFLFGIFYLQWKINRHLKSGIFPD